MSDQDERLVKVGAVKEVIENIITVEIGEIGNKLIPIDTALRGIEALEPVAESRRSEAEIQGAIEATVIEVHRADLLKEDIILWNDGGEWKACLGKKHGFLVGHKVQVHLFKPPDEAQYTPQADPGAEKDTSRNKEKN